MTEVAGLAHGDEVRTVWFYRDYVRMTGGHLKHSHYFDHVRRTPGFAPRIVFGGAAPSAAQARERARLWPGGEGDSAGRWSPRPRDLLFIAGQDWRYVMRSGLQRLPNPRINLIQHVRHAHEDTELCGYLGERAVRICVSREVADAITATGRTSGPVLTIPNGTDAAPCAWGGDGSPAGYDARPVPVTIAGYKRPELARALSGRLRAAGIEHRLLDAVHRSRRLPRAARGEPGRGLPAPRGGGLLPARARGHGRGRRRGDPGLHRQPGLLPPRRHLPGRGARARVPVRRDAQGTGPVWRGALRPASSGPGCRRRPFARRGAGALSGDPPGHRPRLGRRKLERTLKGVAKCSSCCLPMPRAVRVPGSSSGAMRASPAVSGSEPESGGCPYPPIGRSWS